MQVDRLKQEAQQIEAEIKKIEGLLRQADPDGYYKNGTKAAAAAREKGLRLFYKDKEEKAIFEKQKKLAQASYTILHRSLQMLSMSIIR